MSTRAEPLRVLLERSARLEASPTAPSQTTSARSPWDPDRFANEQLIGLVQHIFMKGAPQPCRQVVLSAIDFETDVGGLCLKIGRILAQCAATDVGVVNAEKNLPTLESFSRSTNDETVPVSRDARMLRDSSRQAANGLWLVPGELFWDQHGGSIEDGLNEQMRRLRHEFDYSIVQAPEASSSGVAGMLGHLSDGLILVLQAHSTRRAAALKVQTKLKTAGVRLLGTVLTGRKFPIPEKLYQRL